MSVTGARGRMTESVPAPVGVLVRAAVAACFVVGGVVALLDQRFVLAGLAFLAGYTALAAAAVAQGQRRRGVGLSLSGLGWLSLAVGVASETALALVAAGVVLLVVGTAVVVRRNRRSGEADTGDESTG